MNWPEKKYEIQEDEEVKNFHKSRRMFCIYNNNLCIAEPNLPFSHAVWFEKEWWLSSENDQIIETATRWIISADGNIYFYVGYDFRIDAKTEEEFFLFIEELVNKLDLDTEKYVFWGTIKGEPWKMWLPRKEYGKISQYIPKNY